MAIPTRMNGTPKSGKNHINTLLSPDASDVEIMESAIAVQKRAKAVKKPPKITITIEPRLNFAGIGCPPQTIRSPGASSPPMNASSSRGRIPEFIRGC